jgi:pyridoxine 5-phosphate synthase
MTKLSVNVNKIALIRNARGTSIPSVVEAAEVCLDAGADGLTVHPRPDGRHVRPDDVREISALVNGTPGVEFNVEGNPVPEFLTLMREVRPTQCTLVPDAPNVLTSDHGWNLAAEGERLRPILRELQVCGIRVSLFMDPDLSQIERAREIGANRIELYTEPYARAYSTGGMEGVLARYVRAAERAQELRLGVNAGHDLNAENLGTFCGSVPGVLEVSIGHALISHALDVGLHRAVREYLNVLHGGVQQVPHA